MDYQSIFVRAMTYVKIGESEQEEHKKGKDVKSMEFELDRKRESVIKVNRRLIRGVGNHNNAIKESLFG